MRTKVGARPATLQLNDLQKEASRRRVDPARFASDEGVEGL